MANVAFHYVLIEDFSKNRKNLKINFAYVSEHYTSFGTIFFVIFDDILVNSKYKIDDISKNINRTNRKIIFSQVSTHYASCIPIYLLFPFFEREGERERVGCACHYLG